MILSSQLLRGDWPAAKTTYEGYLKNESDLDAAKAVIENDLDELEAAGITCPEMAQARAWLKA